MAEANYRAATSRACACRAARGCESCKDARCEPFDYSPTSDGSAVVIGFPPPPDAPSPEVQNQAAASASFAPSPSGPSLCGFGIPTFSLSLSLPGFQFPPAGFPPQLSFGLALRCDLSDPIGAEFGFGGGRVSTSDPDADSQFEDG